jgi:hypothetical protein
VQHGAGKRREVAEDAGSKKPAAYGEKAGSWDQNNDLSGLGRGGFEPPTHGFSVRCSTN